MNATPLHTPAPGKSHTARLLFTNARTPDPWTRPRRNVALASVAALAVAFVALATIGGSAPTDANVLRVGIFAVSILIAAGVTLATFALTGKGFDHDAEADQMIADLDPQEN